MQAITHPRQAVNISRGERIFSGVAGGFLVGVAVFKRSRLEKAFGLIGASLIRRAVTGHSHWYEALGIRTAPRGQGKAISVPYELGVRVDQTVIIARPRTEVFHFWRNLSNLPRFMKHIQSVRQEGARSHWVVPGPGGRTIEWDAVIHNEIAPELIAWRSLPDADVDSAGSVRFREVAGGSATEVIVELQYNPPAGRVGAIFAGVLGTEPGQNIHDGLLALKRILESGELAGEQALLVQASEVDASSEASFPASDPPAYAF